MTAATAHILNLVQASTTVTLTTSGGMLVQYTPTTTIDGQPVTEAIDLVISGSSVANARAKLRDIQRMLTAAEQRNWAQTGPKVYLTYQPIGDTVAWRSEIQGGVVVLDEEATLTLGQAIFPVTLLITRQPFWEGARTQIALTNPNGTNDLTGLAIDNGATNYVGIAASVILGDLPTPLEVQLRNTTGNDRSYYGFHLSNNTFAPTIAIQVEGEDNESSIAGTAVAGASGGEVAVVTGANPASIEFDIPAATVIGYGGRWARVLALCPSVMPGGTGPIYGWAQLYDYYGLVTLYRTPMTLLRTDDYMQDFGAIPLPPGGSNAAGWEQLVLKLWFQGVSTSLAVAVDYIALAPAEARWYRYFVQRGMAVADDDWLIDDGIEGAQYLIENSANHPIYATVTPPVHVQPAAAQRLYIWQEGSSVLATWSMEVKAYYRPRIATL